MRSRLRVYIYILKSVTVLGVVCSEGSVLTTHILGLPSASGCFQEDDTNQLCICHDLVRQDLR